MDVRVARSENVKPASQRMAAFPVVLTALPFTFPTFRLRGEALRLSPP